MRKALKRIISFVIIIATLLSVITMSGCNRTYDEAEVLAAAKELLAGAEILNYVYYGEGIDYFDIEEEGLGYYRRAVPTHLSELGFKTIDELRTMTEAVYSKSYSEHLFSTVLSSQRDGDVIVAMARYYQVYNEETGEPTDIMVYSKYNVIFKDKLEYDYDSLQIKGSKREKVYLTVNATVTNSEGKTQVSSITVTLFEEENGWRIDNPTYANYSEYRDQYNDLNKSKIN